MPVRMTPLPEETVATKRWTPPDCDDDPESPTYEYIEILSFLRQEVIDAAQREGTRTITERGRTREERNMPVYMTALFRRQVTGWRLLDEHGHEIPFTPEHLTRLPWDLQGLLHQEILNCGGLIATRDLVVRTEDGVLLDYKSPDGSLRAGPVSALHDPDGVAAVQQGRSRDRSA